MKALTVLAVFCLSLAPLAAQETAPAFPVRASFEAEFGAVKVLSHTLQFGETGTVFDYVTMGGQEILFPYSRLNARLDFGARHRVEFLYQPLVVETQTVFRDDVTIDGTLFSAGTGMNLVYGFSFWRASYAFDFFPARNLDLAVGLALQLRNASIRFEALDGSALTINQNLGPVPAFFLDFAYAFPNGLFVEARATGVYASSAFFNGADFQFTGSLLDASARVGMRILDGVDGFLSLRYLGGTAEGVSSYPNTSWTQGLEDYTNNRLSTMALTLGARWTP